MCLQPLRRLLDLVAIGLIADLVQLTGDCRYLAKRGIQKLEQQLTRKNRPGVARLLELCKKTGDRPTDISFWSWPPNQCSEPHSGRCPFLRGTPYQPGC